MRTYIAIKEGASSPVMSVAAESAEEAVSEMERSGKLEIGAKYTVFEETVSLSCVLKAVPSKPIVESLQPTEDMFPKVEKKKRKRLRLPTLPGLGKS